MATNNQPSTSRQCKNINLETQRLQDFQLIAAQNVSCLEKQIREEEKAIAEQSATIKSIESNIANMEHQLQYERYAKTELSRDIIKLRQQFNNINEPTNIISTTLESLKMEEETLDKSLDDDQKLLEQEKAKLGQKSSEDNETIKFLLEKIQSDGSLFKNEIEQLDSKNVKYSDIVHTLNAEILKLDNEMQENQTLVANKEDMFVKMQGAHEQLTQKLYEAEAQKHKMNKEMEKQEMQYNKAMEQFNCVYEDLSDNLNQSETEISDLEKRLSNQNAYNTNLKQQIELLKTGSDDMERIYAKLQSEIAEKTGNCDKQEVNMQEDITHLESKLQSKQDQFNELQLENVNFDDELKKVEGEIQSIQTNTSKVQAEIVALTEATAEIIKPITTLENSNEKLSSEIQIAKQELSRLQSKLSNISCEQNEEEITSQSEIHQLNQSEYEMELKIQQQTTELNDCKNKLDRESEDLSKDFGEKSAVLQHQIEALEKQRTALMMENSEAENSLKSVTLECDIIHKEIKNMELSNQMLKQQMGKQVVSQKSDTQSSNPQIKPIDKAGLLLPPPVIKRPRAFDEFSDSSTEGSAFTARHLQEMRRAREQQKMAKQAKKFKNTK